MIELTCERCGTMMQWDETEETEFAGQKCTVAEYLERSKDNPYCWNWCSKCIAQTPDAWELFEKEEVNSEIPNNYKQ